MSDEGMGHDQCVLIAHAPAGAISTCERGLLELRIGDCQLVSAGGHAGETIWVYTMGRDRLVPITDVLDPWETCWDSTGDRWSLR